MPKKCSVNGCKTGYASQKAGKVSVFRLPSEPEERQKWIDNILKVNESLKVTEDTVVCSKHWPVGYTETRQRGHNRPLYPPSVFGNVILPTEERRNHMFDHSYSFSHDVFDKDKINFKQLKDKLQEDEYGFHEKTVIFEDNDKIYCQSKEFYEGVTKFLIIIFNDLNYEVFNHGVKTAVSTPNRIRLLDRWSKLGEMILNSMILDHKKEVLLQQFSLLGASQAGQKVYPPDALKRI